MATVMVLAGEFLSIQAQDFIEERIRLSRTTRPEGFLSIQAQDFIEDRGEPVRRGRMPIPEHSSSGLH